MLSEQAVVIGVLDGDGLVRSRRHLDASGTELQRETWRRDGTMEEAHGIGAAGSWSEQHDREGALSTIEESLGDGASCSLLLEEGRVARAWVTESDGSVVSMEQGRSGERRVAACPMWERHPDLKP